MSNVKTDSIKATEIETKANAGDELTDGQLDAVAGGGLWKTIVRAVASLGGGGDDSGGGNAVAGVRG